jgi:uncharacterized membrane protein YfcA
MIKKPHMRNPLPVRKGHGDLALGIVALAGLMSGFVCGAFVAYLVDPTELAHLRALVEPKGDDDT